MDNSQTEPQTTSQVAASAAATETALAQLAATGAASPVPAQGVEVTYLPKEGDPINTVFRRVSFSANKPVLVRDPDLLEKLKGNPWFKVGDHPIAKSGYNPKTEQPKNSLEYRVFAVDWIKSADSATSMSGRWMREEGLRVACDVANDDLDYVAGFFNPKLEQLRKQEEQKA